MTLIKSARMLGTAAVLVAVPLVSAMPQTQSPAPSPTTPPPAAAKPEIGTPPAQRPPIANARKATAATVNPLVGLTVMSSDGIKLGTVRSVMTEPSGKTTAIYLKTGGFLGFGGHTVAIPDGKFTRAGDAIQASMTADEVSKLPEAKEQS